MIKEPFSMAMSPVCPGSHSDFPWQGAKRGWLAKRFSTSDLPSSWRVVNMAAPAKRGEDFSKHVGNIWGDKKTRINLLMPLSPYRFFSSLSFCRLSALITIILWENGTWWEILGKCGKHHVKHQGTSGKYVGQSFVYRYNPQNIIFKRENMGTCCTQRCSPPSQHECWPPRYWSLRGFHFGSKWTHCIGIYWDSVTPESSVSQCFFGDLATHLGFEVQLFPQKLDHRGNGFERMIWGNHIETAPGGQMDLSILFKCLHLG